MDIKTPTLTDTIVSNKGRYYGAADRVDLHFAFGKIMVALRRAVARNSPPDCCIQIGSSPISNTIPNKNTTRMGGVYIWWTI